MSASFRSLGLITIMLSSLTLARATSSNQAAADHSLEKRVKVSEAACIQNLRTINTAQSTYWGGDETKGFARTLRELGPAGAGLLEPAIASGKKGGYRYRLSAKTITDQPIKHYIVTATPIKRLAKHQRGFFTDETGVIRFTTENRVATRTDPPL
jgi:hypothetical protein